MQDKPYKPGKVNAVEYAVYVNGIQRKHKNMSWGIDTTGGLPENIVNAGTGMRSRTGSITWNSAAKVRTSPFAPIGETEWVPTPGDSVYITATFNGEIFERFKGYLGKTTVSLVGSEVSSDIYDGLAEQLTGNVNIPPQMVAGTPMYMKSSWVAYQALEQVGLGTLPPYDPANTILHNSFQSGTTPFEGIMETAPAVGTDPYGIDWGSGRITERERYEEEPYLKRGKKDVFVIARLAPNSTELLSATVELSNGTKYGATYNPVTHVTQMLDVSNGNAVLASATVSEPDTIPFLAFRLGNEEIKLWVGRDKQVDAPVKALNNYDTSLNVVAVEVTGQCVGVTVRYTWYMDEPNEIVRNIPTTPAQWQRSTAVEKDRLYATRGFENVQAKHVISEWGNATLSVIWKDEAGVVQVRARDRLKNQAVRGNDYVDEKVFSGKWERARDDVYAGVNVKGSAYTLSNSSTEEAHAWKVTVYQPQSVIQHDKSSTGNELFINVPAEEDWGIVDTSIDKVAQWSGFKNGSMIATTTAAKNGSEEIGGDYDNDIATNMIQLGQKAYKINYNVAVASGQVLYLKTPATNTSLHPAYRDKNMPMIRAKWRTRWYDYTVTSPNVEARDLRNKPMFTLEAGWWLSRNDAERMRVALESEVTVPTVTFNDVKMLYNPTVQVGDLKYLTGQTVDKMGNRSNSWRIKYLVTGYSESVDENHVPTWSVDMDAFDIVDLRAVNSYQVVEGWDKTYAGLEPYTYEDVETKNLGA